MDGGEGGRRPTNRELLDTAHSYGTSPRPARHLSPRTDPRTIGEAIWQDAIPGCLAFCTGPAVMPIVVPWGHHPHLVPRVQRARYLTGGVYDPEEGEAPERGDGASALWLPPSAERFRSTHGVDLPPRGVGHQRLGEERVRPGLHDPLHALGMPDYVLSILEPVGYHPPRERLPKQAAGQARDRYRQAVALSEFLKYGTRRNDDGVPQLAERAADSSVRWEKIFPGGVDGGEPATLQHVTNHKSAWKLIGALQTAWRHHVERPMYQRGPVNFPAFGVGFDLAEPDPSRVDPGDFRRRVALGCEVGWHLGIFPFALGSNAPGDLGGLPLVTQDYDWVEEERFVVEINRWIDQAEAERRALHEARTTRFDVVRPRNGPGATKSMIVNSLLLAGDAPVTKRPAPRTEAALVKAARDRGGSQAADAMADDLAELRLKRAAGKSELREEVKRGNRRAQAFPDARLGGDDPPA